MQIKFFNLYLIIIWEILEIHLEAETGVGTEIKKRKRNKKNIKVIKGNLHLLQGLKKRRLRFSSMLLKFSNLTFKTKHNRISHNISHRRHNKQIY